MNINQKLDVTATIDKEIEENDIVLFMKGTPVFPMCGFSAAVSGIPAPFAPGAVA